MGGCVSRKEEIIVKNKKTAKTTQTTAITNITEVIEEEKKSTIKENISNIKNKKNSDISFGKDNFNLMVSNSTVRIEKNKIVNEKTNLQRGPIFQILLANHIKHQF